MEELDLKELMYTVWRKKVIVIVLVILFGVIGAIYSYTNSEPLYMSSSTIILGKIETSTGDTIGNNDDSDTSILQEEVNLNSSLIETYTELVQSRSLIERVQNNLGVTISTDSITVSRVNSSSLLEITATNADPVIASKIVTEVVEIFSEYVGEIYSISNVYVVDEASVPTAPYNINHAKDILIFVVIGLVIALVYILLYFIIDNTVKSEEDLEKSTNIKALISIPLDKQNLGDLVTASEGKAVISEVFRTLRTNIQFGSINSREQKTLLVTSCGQEEGKSFIACNLAITFAQTGKRVILVDADMRRGRQSSIFNVVNKYGFSNYISNLDINGTELNLKLENCINKTYIDNLDMMISGDIPPNPAELLESPRTNKLIEELKRRYDVVIFDGAPILPVTDSLLLARLLENTVLVAAFNKTKKDDLVKVKKDIEEVGGKVIGVCLNKVEAVTPNGYKSNYYYYSHEPQLKGIKKIIANIKIKLSKKSTPKRKAIDAPNENTINFVNEPEKVEEISEEVQEEIATPEKPEKIKKEKNKKEENRIKESKIKEVEQEEENEQLDLLEQEREKEEALMAEEKAKEEEEARRLKEEEKAKKEEERKIKEQELAEERARKEEEKAAKKKEKEEQRKQKSEEFTHKFNVFKGKILVKKDEITEEIAIRKQAFSEKNQAKKALREEENKIKNEQKAVKNAEIIKIREEEKARRAEEREKRQKELAEEKARREKEAAEEKARKEKELAEAKEKEAQRIAEEKAKEAAKIAEEKAEQEVELYPKTKFNNF